MTGLAGRPDSQFWAASKRPLTAATTAGALIARAGARTAALAAGPIPAALAAADGPGTAASVSGPVTGLDTAAADRFTDAEASPGVWIAGAGRFVAAGDGLILADKL